MTKQNEKRAVIISNIKSDMIEQAIFILKNPGNECERVYSPIVAEAQQIINSYICTMEGIRPECRKKSKLNKKLAFIGLAAVSIFVFAAILHLSL